MSAQCLCKLGMVTYFQLNRDYIAEVLCLNRNDEMTVCKGQCYLKKNLDLAGKDEQPAPAAQSSGKKVEIPVFIISDNPFQSSIVFALAGPNFQPVDLTLVDFTVPVFHPPSKVA
jgi:hypothetical protein